MKKIFYLITFLAVSLAFHPLYSQDNDKKAEKTLVVIEKEEPQPILSIVDSFLHVKNAPVGSKLEIMTVVGSKVKEIEIKNSDDSYELNLPRAIYIFKLGSTVRKFVIK